MKIISLSMCYLLFTTLAASIPQNTPATTVRKSQVAPTIYGLVAQQAAGNPAEFMLLKKALDTANLRSILDAPTPPKTAFAPTDAAFLKLARALMYNGSNKDQAFAKIVEFLTFVGNGDPITPLTNILKYHVVIGQAVTQSQAVAAGTITTAFDSTTIHVRSDGTLVDKAPQIPDPKLVTGLTDITASNGIVHAIDGVLLPFPIANSVASFLGMTPTPTAAAPALTPPRKRYPYYYPQYYPYHYPYYGGGYY